MPSNSIATLYMDLRASTRGFNRDIQKALSSTRKTLNRFAKTLTAGVTAATAGLTVMVAQTAKAGDELLKTADKIGATTKGLASLRHAAELTGVATTKLDTGLQRMTRRIAEAAQGSGEAQGALKELGLDAQELSQLRPEQAFERLSDAFGDVESQSDRVRLAFKLFDSEGVGLVNTLALGSEGLQEVAREAERMGIALDRADAVRFAEMRDSITRLQAVFSGLRFTIAAELAPAFTTVADIMRDSITQGDGVRNTYRGIGQDFANLVGVVGTVVQGFKFVVDAIRLAGTELVRAWAGIGVTVSRVIATASTLLSGFVEENRQTINGVIDSIETVVNSVIQGIEGAINLAIQGIRKLLQVANSVSEKVNKTLISAGKDPVSPLFTLPSQEPFDFGDEIKLPRAGEIEGSLGRITELAKEAEQDFGRLGQASADSSAKILEGLNETIDGGLFFSKFKERLEEARESIVETKGSVDDLSNGLDSSLGQGSAAAGAVQDMGDSLNEMAERFRDLGTTDAQRLNQEMANLNLVLQEGLITQEQYQVAADSLRERYQSAAQGIGDTFETVGGEVENVIEQWARTGELNFDRLRDVAIQSAIDIASQWIRQLAGIQGQAQSTGNTIAQVLNAASGFSGGGGGGGSSTLSTIGTIASVVGGFGGFFADGGRPPMGKVSVVGEEGPEFFIPDQRGTIVPMDRMSRSVSSGGSVGGFGSSQPIQNINFEAGQDEARLYQAASDIREGLTEGLVDGVRRGGTFSKAFG